MLINEFLEEFVPKKIIRYWRARYLVKGRAAFVDTVDQHPNCETKSVLTSRVVDIKENGKDFETENTFYKFEPLENSSV